VTKPRDLIIVFGTVQRVMRAESQARKRGLDVDVIPAPRSVSSECGFVIEARSEDASRWSGLLQELELTPQSVFRHTGGGWVPGSLETGPRPSNRPRQRGR